MARSRASLHWRCCQRVPGPPTPHLTQNSAFASDSAISLSLSTRKPEYAMRRAVMALVLLLVLSVECRSQTNNCSDPNATPIDTVSVDVSVGAWTKSIWEVWIERSGGQVQYVINVTSIHFTGDGATVDAMSTKQIFDMIAQTTVAQGVALGHTSCPSNCNAPTLAVVKIPACVQRLGTGLGTHFTVCGGGGCCTRVYNVCCPTGSSAPQITLASSSSPGCSGAAAGCESTCP